MKRAMVYVALAGLLVLMSGVAEAAPPAPGMAALGYQVVSTSATISANVISGSAAVACPAGKVVLGGGARLTTGPGFELEHSGIRESRPTDSNDGWIATSFGEQNNQVRTLTVWAICAAA